MKYDLVEVFAPDGTVYQIMSLQDAKSFCSKHKGYWYYPLEIGGEG